MIIDSIPPKSHRCLTHQAMIFCLCVALPFIAVGLIGNHILQHHVFDFEIDFMWQLHAVSGSLLRDVSVGLHWLGTWYIASVFVLLGAIYEWRKHRLARGVFLLLGSALSTTIMSLFKNLFNRARPELWAHVVQESSASFPSGHSTFAAAFSLCWIILYWHSRWRMVFTIAGCGFTLAMAYSRMLLGVHYPSDVFSGCLTGWATVWAIYLTLQNRLSCQGN